MNKWLLLEELPRFNLWWNRKGQYRETFLKMINPNTYKEENQEKERIQPKKERNIIYRPRRKKK